MRRLPPTRVRLLALFLEKDLPDPVERERASQGRPTRGGLVHRIVKRLLPIKFDESLTLRVWPQLEGAGTMLVVRERLVAFGEQADEDFSDTSAYSVRRKTFHHADLGHCTLITVLDKRPEHERHPIVEPTPEALEPAAEPAETSPPQERPKPTREQAAFDAMVGSDETIEGDGDTEGREVDDLDEFLRMAIEEQTEEAAGPREAAAPEPTVEKEEPPEPAAKEEPVAPPAHETPTVEMPSADAPTVEIPCPPEKERIVKTPEEIPEGLCHLVLFLEKTPDDPEERARADGENALLPDGRLDQLLRKGLRVRIPADCEITVYAGLGKRACAMTSIRNLVADTGARFSLDYSDRSLFKVNKRNFRDESLGNCSLVGVLRLPYETPAVDEAPAPPPADVVEPAEPAPVEAAAAPAEAIEAPAPPPKAKRRKGPFLAQVSIFLEGHPWDDAELTHFEQTGRPRPGGLIASLLDENLPVPLEAHIPLLVVSNHGPEAQHPVALRGRVMQEGAKLGLDFEDASRFAARGKRVFHEEFGHGVIVSMLSREALETIAPPAPSEAIATVAPEEAPVHVEAVAPEAAPVEVPVEEEEEEKEAPEALALSEEELAEAALIDEMIEERQAEESVLADDLLAGLAEELEEIGEEEEDTAAPGAVAEETVAETAVPTDELADVEEADGFAAFAAEEVEEEADAAQEAVEGGIDAPTLEPWVDEDEREDAEAAFETAEEAGIPPEIVEAEEETGTPASPEAPTLARWTEADDQALAEILEEAEEETAAPLVEDAPPATIAEETVAETAVPTDEVPDVAEAAELETLPAEEELEGEAPAVEEAAEEPVVEPEIEAPLLDRWTGQDDRALAEIVEAEEEEEEAALIEEAPEALAPEPAVEAPVLERWTDEDERALAEMVEQAEEETTVTEAAPPETIVEEPAPEAIEAPPVVEEEAAEEAVAEEAVVEREAEEEATLVEEAPEALAPEPAVEAPLLDRWTEEDEQALAAIIEEAEEETTVPSEGLLEVEETLGLDALPVEEELEEASAVEEAAEEAVVEPEIEAPLIERWTDQDDRALAEIVEAEEEEAALVEEAPAPEAFAPEPAIEAPVLERWTDEDERALAEMLEQAEEEAAVTETAAPSATVEEAVRELIEEALEAESPPAVEEAAEPEVEAAPAESALTEAPPAEPDIDAPVLASWTDQDDRAIAESLDLEAPPTPVEEAPEAPVLDPWVEEPEPTVTPVAEVEEAAPVAADLAVAPVLELWTSEDDGVLAATLDEPETSIVVEEPAVAAGPVLETWTDDDEDSLIGALEVEEAPAEEETAPVVEPGIEAPELERWTDEDDQALADTVEIAEPEAIVEEPVQPEAPVLDRWTDEDESALVEIIEAQEETIAEEAPPVTVAEETVVETALPVEEPAEIEEPVASEEAVTVEAEPRPIEEAAIEAPVLEQWTDEDEESLREALEAEAASAVTEEPAAPQAPAIEPWTDEDEEVLGEVLEMGPAPAVTDEVAELAAPVLDRWTQEDEDALQAMVESAPAVVEEEAPPLESAAVAEAPEVEAPPLEAAQPQAPALDAWTDEDEEALAATLETVAPATAPEEIDESAIPFTAETPAVVGEAPAPEAPTSGIEAPVLAAWSAQDEAALLEAAEAIEEVEPGPTAVAEETVAETAVPTGELMESAVAPPSLDRWTDRDDEASAALMEAPPAEVEAEEEIAAAEAPPAEPGIEAPVLDRWTDEDEAALAAMAEEAAPLVEEPADVEADAEAAVDVEASVDVEAPPVVEEEAPPVEAARTQAPVLDAWTDQDEEALAATLEAVAPAEAPEEIDESTVPLTTETAAVVEEVPAPEATTSGIEAPVLAAWSAQDEAALLEAAEAVEPGPAAVAEETVAETAVPTGELMEGAVAPPSLDRWTDEDEAALEEAEPPALQEAPPAEAEALEEEAPPLEAAQPQAPVLDAWTDQDEEALAAIAEAEPPSLDRWTDEDERTIEEAEPLVEEPADVEADAQAVVDVEPSVDAEAPPAVEEEAPPLESAAVTEAPVLDHWTDEDERTIEEAEPPASQEAPPVAEPVEEPVEPVAEEALADTDTPPASVAEETVVETALPTDDVEVAAPVEAEAVIEEVEEETADALLEELAEPTVMEIIEAPPAVAPRTAAECLTNLKWAVRPLQEAVVRGVALSREVFRQLDETLTALSESAHWRALDVSDPAGRADAAERMSAIRLVDREGASLFRTMGARYLRVTTGEHARASAEACDADALDDDDRRDMAAALWFACIGAVARRAESDWDTDSLESAGSLVRETIGSFWGRCLSENDAVSQCASDHLAVLGRSLANFNCNRTLLALAQCRDACEPAGAVAPLLAEVRDAKLFDEAVDAYRGGASSDLELLHLLSRRNARRRSFATLFVRVHAVIAGFQEFTPQTLGEHLRDAAGLRHPGAAGLVMDGFNAFGPAIATDAFAALARLRAPECLGFLIDHVRDEDDPVTQAALETLPAFAGKGLLDAARKAFDDSPRPALLDAVALDAPKSMAGEMFTWTARFPEPVWQAALGRAAGRIDLAETLEHASAVMGRDDAGLSDHFLAAMLGDPPAPARGRSRNRVVGLLYAWATRLTASDDRAVAGRARTYLSALLETHPLHRLYECCQLRRHTVTDILAPLRQRLLAGPAEKTPGVEAAADLLGAFLLIPRLSDDATIITLLWKSPDAEVLEGLLHTLADHSTRPAWKFAWRLLFATLGRQSASQAHASSYVVQVLFKALIFPQTTGDAYEALKSLLPEFPIGAQDAITVALPTPEAFSAHMRRVAIVNPRAAADYLRHTIYDEATPAIRRLHQELRRFVPVASMLDTSADHARRLLDELAADDPRQRTAAVGALDVCAAEGDFRHVLDQWLAGFDPGDVRRRTRVALALATPQKVRDPHAVQWRTAVLEALGRSNASLAVTLRLLLDCATDEQFALLLDRLRDCQPYMPWQQVIDVFAGAPCETADWILELRPSLAFTAMFSLWRAATLPGDLRDRAREVCEYLARKPHLREIIGAMFNTLSVFPTRELLDAFLEATTFLSGLGPVRALRDTFVDAKGDVAWIAYADRDALRWAAAFASQALVHPTTLLRAAAVLKEIVRHHPDYLRTSAIHDAVLRRACNVVLHAGARADHRIACVELLDATMDTSRRADQAVLRRLAAMDALADAAGGGQLPHEQLLRQLIDRLRGETPPHQ